MPVGVADVFAFLLVGDLYGDPEPAYVAFVAACLAFAAVLCAWQAQNHDRAREQLMLMSRTDPLTDCLNRRGFEERVRGRARRRRSGTAAPLALVLLDLDNFKAVNDLHGHAAGDELLCWVVESLRATVRPMDTVGQARAATSSRCWRQGCRRTTRSRSASGSGRVLAERIAVTTGVACFPVDGVDHDELQRHADSHLYEQKHGLANELRRRPARAELGGDARASGRRAHGESPPSTPPTVARYAAGIAQRLGWGGADLALPARRGDAPRRRQGLAPRPDPAESPARSTSASTRRSRRIP